MITLHRFKTVLAGLDKLIDAHRVDRDSVVAARTLLIELYAKSRELDLLTSATRGYLSAAANPLADSPKITHDVVEED